jgi:hypothetical protein
VRAPQEAALVGAALPTVSTSEFEEVARSLAVSRQECEELDQRLSKATLETVQTHSEECPPDHPQVHTTTTTINLCRAGRNR